jgi:hypothetical protein
MDALHVSDFFRYYRSGSPRSRRGLLPLLASTLVAILPFVLGPGAAAAKKHRGKKRKKKRRSHTSLPPGPITMADATCRPATPISFTGFRRYAQTFVAQRSGQLTSAAFTLNFSKAGGAFNLEIRAVDMAGTPSTVLASTAISNVPATGDTDPPRTVTGVFAAPAAVVAGQIYALTVTDVANLTYDIQVGGDDPCPYGIAFLDALADGSFMPQATYDLTFTSFVTA